MRAVIAGVGGAVAVAAVFLATAGQARDYDWTNDVPAPLKGTWVVQGQRCTSDDSRLAIFSDGGYRWRKSRTDWGFARGKYSWTMGSNTVFFRVQRFIQQDGPDFQITVGGTQMRKYSLGSGQLVSYTKCR